MSNFKLDFTEPWTTYDNKLIQEETVFKNPYQKLGYLFLYSYARAEKIFPSMEKIAAAICSKKRHAINTIKELEKMGFIVVERNSGKSNEYTLKNYFEVAAVLTSANNAPVQDMHQSESPIESPKKMENISDEKTGAQYAPVQDVHHTGAYYAPVEPKLVHNMHPITSSLKTKKKNSISSSLASPNLAGMELIDKNLKKQFPNAPFDSIKAEMMEQAEKGEVEINTGKQYTGLLKFRLENYKEPRQAGTAQIRTKQPIRTEYIPEHMKSEFEPATLFSDENETERKRMRVDLALKKFRGEITEEEYKKGMELLVE
jgi:hypothetical protein